MLSAILTLRSQVEAVDTPGILISVMKIQRALRQIEISGPGCSKLTTSLVNETLKFQTLISHICQYFFMKKCEELLQCKSFSHFFNKNYQYIWLLSRKTLNKLTS